MKRNQSQSWLSQAGTLTDAQDALSERSESEAAIAMIELGGRRRKEHWLSFGTSMAEGKQ